MTVINSPEKINLNHLLYYCFTLEKILHVLCLHNDSHTTHALFRDLTTQATLKQWYLPKTNLVVKLAVLEIPTAVIASKVVLEVMVKDVSLAGFPLNTTAKHLFYSYAARQMKSKK